MHYQWITVVFALASLTALIVALVLLTRRNWFLGWLKGTGGILALVLAVILALTAVNANGYRPLNDEYTVATISFARTGDQQFQASLVLQSNGTEMPFDMNGDLWQIDARVIKWKGLLAALGGQPSYKLDRLQGRYYSLEDEQTKPRSIFALSNPDVGFDLWSVVRGLSRHLAWFDAEYGSATFLPMADGAQYSVRLTPSGMVARPENAQAEQAVKDWQ
ncbi:MAG TPA: hypothetical protein VM553_04525 [Dongiaceae bacterium]|nr:hypothetical protein [Dongiaceae bacterium]